MTSSELLFFFSFSPTWGTPPPFLPERGPWRCSAQGSGRLGWCAAPHWTAPASSEWWPDYSNTSPYIPAPLGPQPSCRHVRHLQRRTSHCAVLHNSHHFYFVLVLQQKKCDQKILSWSRLTFKSWTSVSFLMFDKFLPKNVLLKKLVTTLMSSCLHEGMLPVTWSMLGNECQQSREHICVDAPG